MSTQRFVDALSGADGTQALRVRSEVPPVYPDPTVPVATARITTVPITTVRPARGPQVAVRIPEIDPRVARAVAELAGPDRPVPRAVPAGRRSDQRPPRAAAPVPPTRAQAARADFYQGPTPTAVSPAQEARHHHRPVEARPGFPAPWTQPGALAGQADRLRAQLGQFGRQFGTGNPRTPPIAPSSPQRGPQSTVPTSVFQPQPTVRRRANTVQIVFVLLFFLLVLSGLGAQLVEVVTDLLRR